MDEIDRQIDRLVIEKERRRKLLKERPDLREELEYQDGIGLDGVYEPDPDLR